MLQASIVIPTYNMARYLPEAIDSALAQEDVAFEVIVLDDGSTDETPALVARYTDPRLRYIRQENRGLNGARNSGIHAARAPYVGLMDADDRWAPEKLARHVAHLDGDPAVGLSFSGSRLIDQDGKSLGLSQRPQLTGITAATILARNPIGNGSAAVLRKAALEDLAFHPAGEAARAWYFDERFRQSTDVECWLRLALQTDWKIAGIPGLLCDYRINHGGLSANVVRQYETWEKVAELAWRIDPAFARREVPRARGYQLRYLARRAVSMRERGLAWSLTRQALQLYPAMLIEEPVKSLTSLLAAALLRFGGSRSYGALEGLALQLKRRAV